MSRPLPIPAKLAGTVLKPVVTSTGPGAIAAKLAERPSASTFTPDLAGAKATSNNFQTFLFGPNPPESAGDPGEQAFQLIVTSNLALFSMLDALPLAAVPPRRIEKTLQALEPSRLLPNSPVTKATYTSQIPNVPPEKVFEYFSANVKRLFGAGGLQLHPARSSMSSGDRFFIADNWATPWMPVEAKVDRSEKSIVFDTLDGHPFRGFNGFELQSDGKGGTLVVQRSEFQASSEAAEKGYALQRAHARQTETWRSLHNALFRAFA